MTEPRWEIRARHYALVWGLDELLVSRNAERDERKRALCLGVLAARMGSAFGFGELDEATAAGLWALLGGHWPPNGGSIVLACANDRGLMAGSWIDASGRHCSVQESSAVEVGDSEGPFLWLGADPRAHLSRANVCALLPLLHRFAHTGRLS